MICNLPEGAEGGFGPGAPPMETIVEDIVRLALGIELQPGSIQRAHRVGKKQVSRPRDIVINFLRHTDKERVRKAAPLRKPTYKERKIYFNEDFSPYVLKRRQVLGEEMRRRRNEGQRSWLSRDRLMFIQDDFVYEITVNGRFFNMSEPRRLFKARYNTRTVNSAARARGRVASNSSSRSSTSSIRSPMSGVNERGNSASSDDTHDIAAEEPVSPSIIGDKLEMRPIAMRSAVVIATPAPGMSQNPVNPRKARTPPTPSDNPIEKHPRTDVLDDSLENPRASASLPPDK